MNFFKKIMYNNPLKDSHSYIIHTCFPIIASNEYTKVSIFCCWKYYERVLDILQNF